MIKYTVRSIFVLRKFYFSILFLIFFMTFFLIVFLSMGDGILYSAERYSRSMGDIEIGYYPNEKGRTAFHTKLIQYLNNELHVARYVEFKFTTGSLLFSHENKHVTAISLNTLNEFQGVSLVKGKYPVNDEVMVSTSVANVNIGEEVTFFYTDTNNYYNSATAIVSGVFSANDTLESCIVFSSDSFNNIYGSQIPILYCIYLDNNSGSKIIGEQNYLSLRKDFLKSFADFENRYYISYQSGNMYKETKKLMSYFYSVFLFLIFVLLFLSFSTITNALTTITDKKQNDIGIFISLGCSKKNMAFYLMFEVFLCSFIAFLLGCFLSVLFCHKISQIPIYANNYTLKILLGDSKYINFLFSFKLFFISFIICIITPCYFAYRYILKLVNSNIIRLLKRG